MATISGVVHDIGAASPLRGATLTLEPAAGGDVVASAVSGVGGAYRLSAPLGAYLLRASASGYTASSTAIVLSVETATGVDVSLSAVTPILEVTSPKLYFPDSASVYSNFTTTCPIATGQATTCGTNPGSPASWNDLRLTGQVLFVWGPYISINNVGTNSTIQWYNTLKGGVSGNETFAIRVTGFRLTANGLIGTPPGGPEGYFDSTGQQYNGEFNEGDGENFAVFWLDTAAPQQAEDLRRGVPLWLTIDDGPNAGTWPVGFIVNSGNSGGHSAEWMYRKGHLLVGTHWVAASTSNMRLSYSEDGTSDSGRNQIGQPQGVGITGAWEAHEPEMVSLALIGDSRIQVKTSTGASWYGSNPASANGNRLIDTPALAGTPWIDLVAKTTVQTPVDKYFVSPTTVTAAANTVQPNQSFQIRLFNADFYAAPTFPAAVLSATYLQVEYSRARLQGSLDFGYTRVGTAKVVGASIRNLTDAAGGLKASVVVAGTASSPFAAVSGQTLGTLTPSESYNTTARYRYTPSGLHGGVVAYTETSSPIALTSTDALDTTFIATGEAVGPVLSLVGAGAAYTDDGTGGGAAVCATLDLGNLDGTTTRAITISNAFTDVIGLVDEANLTLLSVGFGPAYTQTIAVGTALFRIEESVSGQVLNPSGRGGSVNSVVIHIGCSGLGSEPASASLRILTDTNTALGATGVEYRFDVLATAGAVVIGIGVADTGYAGPAYAYVRRSSAGVVVADSGYAGPSYASVRRSSAGAAVEDSGYAGPSYVWVNQAAKAFSVRVVDSGYAGLSFASLVKPANGIVVADRGYTGAAHATLSQMLSIRVSGPAIPGNAYAMLRAKGDTWAAQGFPPPKREGYGYSRPSGVRRTKYVSGATRQRRGWADGYRIAPVSFNVDRSMLYAVERFIADNGHDWFTMGMVTSDNTTPRLEIHTVRIIENVTFGALYGESIGITLKVELQ